MSYFNVYVPYKQHHFIRLSLQSTHSLALNLIVFNYFNTLTIVGVKIRIHVIISIEYAIGMKYITASRNIVKSIIVT